MRSRFLILLAVVALGVCLAGSAWGANAERSWSEVKASYSQGNPSSNEAPSFPDELVVDRAVQVYGLSPVGGEELVFELRGERARVWIAAIEHVSELVTEPNQPVRIVHSMNIEELRAFTPPRSLTPRLFFDDLITLLPGTEALGEVLAAAGDRQSRPIDTTMSCIKFCYFTSNPGACIMRCNKGGG